jgi:hypothetical protein
MFRTWWQKLFSFPRTRLARRRGYHPPTRLLGRTTRLSITALEDRLTPAAPVALLVAATTGAGILQYDPTTGAAIGTFAAAPAGGSIEGFTYGPDGNLYAGDFSASSVLKYDGTTGALIGTFVASGTGGLNDVERGLAFGPNGNLFVADPTANSILQFNGTTGAFVNTFVSAGSGGLSFPQGMAFGPNGNLFVVSDGSNKVLQYDGSTGAFVNTFANSNLNQPVNLVFGPNGNLFVTNANGGTNGFVSQFNGSTGAFVNTFVSGGSGGLNQAQGLAFNYANATQDLYVTDSLGNNVRRYNGSTGAFVSVFATGANFATFDRFSGTPTISSIPAVPTGTTATVNGTNFTFESRVSVNGAVVATTFVSSTQLQFTAPSTPNTYNVTVYDPNGGTSNTGSLSAVTPAATFTDNGSTLNLDLTAANTNAAIVSNGTSYTITLTGGVWSGTNDANVTGNGTATLTVTAAGIAAFTIQISLVDAAAAGDSVTFNDSGANAYANNFNINLSNAAASAIAFNGHSSFSGADSLSATTTRTIVANSGAVLSAASGNLTLSANEQATPTAGNFVGIDVSGATVTTTGAGNISLTGRGGDDAATGSHVGVFAHNGATISSTGTGTINITGTGGAGIDLDTGVGLGQPNNSEVNGSATVTSVAGAITLTGTGGNGSGAFNIGVLVLRSSQVTSTGTGPGAAPIIITGTGGTGTLANSGVEVGGTGAVVTSIDGAITLTGTGGPGSATLNDGVLIGANVAGNGQVVNTNSHVSSTGVGTITIQGTAGSGTGSGSGIDLQTAGSAVSTGTGNVTLTTDNFVIDTTSTNINAGTNVVTLQPKTAGTAINLGGANAAGTLGLTNAELGTITAGFLQIGNLTTSGDLNVNGAITAPATWSTLALETDVNHGITQAATAPLTVTNLLALGATGVSLTAAGNTVSQLAGASLNTFTFVDSTGLTVGSVGGFNGITTFNDGPISVTALGAGSLLTVNQPISTNNGATAGINLTADGMAINAAVSANAGTGIVTLQPKTTGTFVNLGGADGPGTLGLTNAELALVTAGILRIGDEGGTTSNITVTAPITDVGAGWNTLSLATNSSTGGIISQNAGATLTVTNLRVFASAVINLAESGNTVAQLSGISSGSFTFVDSTSLTVGNVDPGLGFPGVETGFGGAISLTVLGSGNSLTVTNAINTTPFGNSGNITLSADDMAINAAVNAATKIVTLQQGGTTTRPIDLGLGTTPNTLGLSTAKLAQVTAGTLRIGRSDNAGNLTVTAPIANPGGASTLTLTSGGTVAEAAAADTITVTNLAVRAGTGINLDTVVSHLAVRNTTSGTVRVANTGATTLTTVDTLDGSAGNTQGNFGTGTSTFSAASPFTFAVDFTSGGTITTTTADNNGVHVDNITVNSGVTVTSTGGDVVFRAGDDVVINGTVQSQFRDVDLVAGFGDTDNEGVITLNGTVSAVATATLNVNSTNTALGAGTPIATETAASTISAAGLLLLNNNAGAPGPFNLNASTTNAVGTIAGSTNADINFNNSSALTIGSVTSTPEGVTSDGILSNNHAVSIQATGTITVAKELNAGTAAATLNSTGGNILQAATLTTTGVAGGAITLTAAGAGGINLIVATNTPATAGVTATTTNAPIVLASTQQLQVDNINAGTGDVTLTVNNANTAVSSITSLHPNDGVADVTGHTVTLTATGPTTGNTGQIGFFTAAAQFFEVAATTINASTNNSRAWISALGGAAIGQVNVGTNTAFLRTVNGTLTSTHTGNTPDVIAAAVNLSQSATATSGAFGTPTNPLLVQTATLTARVTAGPGSINVTNVTAGGNLAVAAATTTGGDVNLAVNNGNLTTTSTTSPDISAPGGTVTLTVSGAVFSGTGAGVTDVTGSNLAITAAAGIGTAANPLKTAVTNLAFHNTGGSVFIANTGALTINAVGTLNTSFNTGVDTHLSAASPMTFAVDITSGGTLTATTADSGGIHVDNITVNAGVTVKSTGGDVIFHAGDDVVINGTVQSQARDVDLVAGFGDTDNEGVITIGATGAVSAVVTVALNVNSTNSALAAGTPIATEAAGASIIAPGLLLLNAANAAGAFSLDGTTANAVGTIAATTHAAVNFRNSGALTVGSVFSFPEAVTSFGILTNNNDSTLCTIAGDITLSQPFNVGTGTARFQSAGAVTQTAGGKITAANLGVNAVGNIILDQATPTNHVTGTVALNTSAGTVRFMDDSTFTIGTVTAAGCFTGASGITGGGAGQDVTICSPSTINITAPISAPGATVRIQSGGDVTQTAAGTITAANLGVRANGNVNLCVPGSPNVITGIFAADTSGGPAGSGVFFLDNSGYLIGTVTASTCFTANAVGVTTNNGTADLVNTTGNVTLAAGVNAGTGTVRFNSAGAVNSPAGGGSVTAANLAVRANGAVDLCTVANTITGTFAAQDTGAGAAVMFSNAGGFTVGTIADDACAQGATGVVTTNGDIDLVSGGTITLAQAVNAGTATVRINGGSVLQTAGGAGSITATDLAVRAGGNIDLCQVANTVTGNFAAADTAGGAFVRFLDTAGFTVGTVAGDACAAGATGVITTNGDISLNSTAGPITLTQTVSTQVPAGATVRIASGAAVTQTAGGAGAITGGGLAVVANGLVDLCQVANNVGGIFAASDAAAGAAVRFLDSAGFTVDTIAADACAPGATGVTTNNGDVSLVSTGGAIGLTRAVNAGTGTVRLNAGGAVTQTAGGAGAITAGDLAVVAAGNVDLCQVANTVTGNFAASDSAAGAFVRFLDTAAITVGSVAADVCASGATGVTTNNGDVSLNSTAGPITLNAAVNAGTGTVRFQSGVGVTQPGGAITGGGLAVVAAGNVDLTQAGNAVAGNLAISDAAAGATVKFLDTASFTVNTIAADACASGAVGVVTNNGDATLVSSGGSIQLAQGVTTGTATTRLQAATGIASTAATGFITAATVGVRNTTSGDVQLDQANTSPTGTIVFAGVNNGAGAGINFRSAVALNLDTVAADGTLFNAVSGVTTTGAGGTVRLQQTGLTQTAAGIVITDLLGVRNTTAGDIMLDQANTVNTFAADNPVNGNRVTLRDTGALTVGDVAAQGTFATTNGLTATGGTAYLQAGGSVGQTATGLVDSAALAVNNLAGGTIRLDQVNAVTTFAANNAAANGLINFRTTTALTLDTVTSGSALLGPIAGVTTVNGTVLLHSGAGLGQTAAAPVTAATLGVRNDAAGDINLLTAIDYTAGTGNTVGTFAALNGAAGGRADLATLGSLTIADVAGDGTFAAVHGIKTSNGGSNVRSGNSFTANDTNFASNQLVQLGTGEFLVNPGQTLAAQGMVNTVDTVTFDAGIVAGRARFGVPGAVDATATNPGPTGTQIANIAREAFSNIRPSEFTPIFVNGNLPTTFPGDSLTLDVKGATGLTVFVDPGQGNGHFTFTNRQPLVFRSIETLAQRSLLAVSVQTGTNSFQILVQGTFAGLPSSAPFPLVPPQSNPFIVSPQLVNPVQPFGAPRVAVGDVNGDGVTDLIVGAGSGSSPLVTVVDGSKLFGVQTGAAVTGTLIAQFFAYDPRFVGGVFVAVGDLSKTNAGGDVVPGQDGKAEIVTGPDQGGGPHVREFRFTNSGLINDTFADVSVGAAYPAGGFYAYDASFHGGVRVAIGDVDGDGFNDIVTGAGPGGGPHVKVRSGVTGGTIRSFFAYDAAFHGGVFVGAGDYDQVKNGIEPGLGTADIVTGAGQGGGPHVKVFSGADLSVLVSEFAFGRDGSSSLFGPDLGLTTGVGSVSIADVDGDGLPDILVTSARGPRTRIAALRGNGPTPSHIQFVNPPAVPGPGQALNPFPQLFTIEAATGDLMAPTLRDGAFAADFFST